MKKLPPRVSIRRATLKDCSPCQHLGRVPEIAIGPGWYLPLEYYQKVVRGHHPFFVAEVDMKIVGFAIGERIVAILDVSFYSDGLRIAGYLYPPFDLQPHEPPRPGILMLAGHSGNPRVSCAHMMQQLCQAGVAGIRV